MSEDQVLIVVTSEPAPQPWAAVLMLPAAVWLWGPSPHSRPYAVRRCFVLISKQLRKRRARGGVTVLGQAPKPQAR